MIDLAQTDPARAWGPALRGITYNGSAGLIARRVSAAGSPGVGAGEPVAVPSLEQLGSILEQAIARDGHWPGCVRTPQGDTWLLCTDPAHPAEDLPAATTPQIPGRDSVVRGKVALVTGAAQGFGWELAQGLAREGAWVVLADRNLDGARERAAELDTQTAAARGDQGAGPSAPVRHLAVGVDVSDEESVSRMVSEIVDHYGGIDLVVSNAGVVRSAGVSELSAEDFAFVTRVNYTGFFLVAKHCSPVLAAQDQAWRDHGLARLRSGTEAGAEPSRLPANLSRYFTDIVEINSKSGLVGSNRNAAYAGSKFGGIGLVQSFALELVESGIKVNALCPGNFLDGPLWSDPERGLFVQYLKAGKVPGARTVADVRAAYEARVPMGRGCTGADVLRALLYTVEQRYETGQAVPITGGQVMLS